MRILLCSCACLLLLTSVARGDEPNPLSPTPEQIAAWRKEGPAAVDRLMLRREELVAEVHREYHRSKKSENAPLTTTPEVEAAWARVTAIGDTINAVAGARYSHISGLYWYTDEDEARRVAKEQGKPILALRLLGNLNEELSCANSRYFRILLYPDDKVRKVLHDKFVLTWTSVRPVPKITIDLGDGRKVERTITGNSVHYVLTPDGQVVDVFPGLYGPKPFCERLEKAHDAAVKASGSKDAKSILDGYRKERIAELKKAWQADVAKFEELVRRQQSKVVTQTEVGVVPPPPLDFWQVAAEFHPEYSDLSQVSVRMIRREANIAAERSRETVRPTSDLDFAFAKGGEESVFTKFLQDEDVPYQTLLACVRPALRADTIHNEYRGRYVALRYLTPVPSDSPFSDSPFDADFRSFAVAGGRSELEMVNDYVYKEIFHYDLDDPWIGLARLDSLTALPKDRGMSRVEPSPK